MKIRMLTILGLLLASLTLSAPSSLAQDPQTPPSNKNPIGLATADSPSGSEFADFNREIYYKNKLEFSFDTGWLGYNTPLILDPLLGQAFRAYPGLPDYTIVPLIFSVRWHLYDISGRSFWRGNTDASLGGSYNLITSGPESHYAAIITGGRYNFIQPNWRIVPYFEIRGGLGWTNAKQPYEVAHHQPAVGQGQDFTFTFLFGPGVRYNFNPRYSASLGAGYMHISNLYLSEPKYYNHGINVVGVNVGVNVALTRASLDDALSAVGLGDGPRAQPQTSEGSDYMR